MSVSLGWVERRLGPAPELGEGNHSRLTALGALSKPGGECIVSRRPETEDGYDR